MMGVMEATKRLACTYAELDSSTHAAQTDMHCSEVGYSLLVNYLPSAAASMEASAKSC